MRIEIVIDGQSHGKQEFAVAPRRGDGIKIDGIAAVVDELWHNITQNRAEVMCSTGTKRTVEQEAAKRRPQPASVQS